MQHKKYHAEEVRDLLEQLLLLVLSAFPDNDFQLEIANTIILLIKEKEFLSDFVCKVIERTATEQDAIAVLFTSIIVDKMVQLVHSLEQCGNKTEKVVINVQLGK